LLHCRIEEPLMQLKRLGPYELTEPLGKGGMGTVYRAIHRDTGEKAAVKALAPVLAATEGFRDRFEAEIESLKLLRHPGIVRLSGYGEEDGLLFYAMELVEGTSLEEELRAGRRFSWREVTEYGIQICRALKHAHDHGVIHRDIKPANLLIDHQGRIKIADFGIARLFGSTQLTSAGGVLGTADYMPPEQIDGRNVTEKCDQYSLGGVMFSLLAGRPPFRAKSLPEMLQLQRFAEPEPVRRYASDTPEQLERLITQLLSKEPADRFPNTLVLARHMEAMLRALSRPAPDDFALAAESMEPVTGTDASYEVVGMETTRIEPAGMSAVPADGALLRSVPSAPSSTGKATARGSDVTGPITGLRAADDDELKVEAPAERTVREDGAGVREDGVVRPATRFRTVDEDLLESYDATGISKLVFAAQVAGLLAALVLIAVTIWYFSRPATADDLYAQIDKEAETGRADAVRTVERQINEFLRRFPDDSRSQEIAGYKEEIELSRREAQIVLNARSRPGGESFTPIEQLYLDAIRKAQSDPPQAIRDLESILVLYPQDGSAAEDSDASANHLSDEARKHNQRVQECLALIHRRLEQLTRSMEAEEQNQLPLMRRRLKRAHELRTTDPDRAHDMYAAIVQLCEGKVWAQDIVEEATAGIKSMDKATIRDQSPAWEVNSPRSKAGDQNSRRMQ
jgi:serine/threonine-protein kinase